VIEKPSVNLDFLLLHLSISDGMRTLLDAKILGGVLAILLTAITSQIKLGQVSSALL
jgi:hypothetical protein